MFTITQACDSCGTERELTVAGFGDATVPETTQIQRVYDAAESDGWLPLGDTQYLCKDICLGPKLGFVNPPPPTDVPISTD